MGNAKATIRVQVAYATPDEQRVLDLDVPEGTTAGDAIQMSGILGYFPEIDLARQAIGIFGRLIDASERVREGDRVEVYRPLLADPKEIRKQRAKSQRRR